VRQHGGGEAPSEEFVVWLAGQSDVGAFLRNYLDFLERKALVVPD
jgi:hypothetical protein